MISGGSPKNPRLKQGSVAYSVQHSHTYAKGIVVMLQEVNFIMR